MIDVQNVSKQYGDRVAVDDLTFTVKPGIVAPARRVAKRVGFDDLWLPGETGFLRLRGSVPPRNGIWRRQRTRGSQGPQASKPRG